MQLYERRGISEADFCVLLNAYLPVPMDLYESDILFKLYCRMKNGEFPNFTSFRTAEGLVFRYNSDNEMFLVLYNYNNLYFLNPVTESVKTVITLSFPEANFIYLNC
jgi:hypothetical protein